ncbi:MAG: site-specific integrase, partial [Rhodobacteraceae bacterium]|nr:site-specific integrase [Paracoccaceae bacterium]
MTSDTDAVKVNEKLTLYRRANSKRWQARLLLDNGEWHRFSTKTTDFDKAKDFALKQFYTADFRKQNNLPESTRKIKRVALFTRNRMQEELKAGGGRVVFKDYIAAIDRYIIPYFGNMDVAAITVNDLQEFDKWRTDKLGRQASHSTINTHNSALNRVFDEAMLRNWITHAIRPTLLNKGVKANSRGSFTKKEYETVYRGMRTWHKKTTNKKTAETRKVLRNYILFLTNTGVRHGTEALGLKWKNLSWFEQDGERYLNIYVSGKTGGRELIARDKTKDYLDRQRAMNTDLVDMTFDEVIAAKIDDYVFKTESGERAELFNLIRNFRSFLIKNDLLEGTDGKSRTLYSWRHYYANVDLRKGISNHLLGKQMGNSTAVIDKYYSKISPQM